ncbi:hypothetical protein BH09PSE3_BH09PSE3_13010 [soil metagenome]
MGVDLKKIRLWIQRWIVRLIAALVFACASPALAATCAAATSAGTAPSSWQTYCWIDFSSYVDSTARSAGGQNFSITLTDGATLTFNLKATSTAATAVNAVSSPSWSDAAVGNSAFLGIPGKPVLYTSTNGSTVVLTISGIKIMPPAGVTAATSYSVVVADAESTNAGESLTFTTNGGGWTVIDTVPGISGNTYPGITNTGTTFTETGTAGTVGGYIVGSNNPTTITARMVANGLQGVMFAIRFASLALNKSIIGVRFNPADQFAYRIAATSGGTVMASGTTSGTATGPFANATVNFASGLPVTLSEVMTAGSVSPLSNYNSKLTCTNGNSSSSTPLPNNVTTTSYAFGGLAFGDAVSCQFTNAAVPRVALSKALGGARVFTADQFTVNVTTGSTTTATTTTTGTGSTVTNGSIPATVVSAATAYNLAEVAAGSTVLTYYTAGIACTNTYTASPTALPTALPGAVTPGYGDNISCTITNTPKPATATLTVVKTSTVISDPVNGTTNPKAIPGAVIQYAVTIINTGTAAVDASTVVIIDPLPAGVTLSVAAPTVVFIDGTPATGLSFNSASNVTYSNQSTGGAPFTYTPVSSGGYDAAVRGIRIAPTGVMAGTTAPGSPSFTVTFLTRIN